MGGSDGPRGADEGPSAAPEPNEADDAIGDPAGRGGPRKRSSARSPFWGESFSPQALQPPGGLPRKRMPFEDHLAERAVAPCGRDAAQKVRGRRRAQRRRTPTDWAVRTRPSRVAFAVAAVAEDDPWVSRPDSGHRPNRPRGRIHAPPPVSPKSAETRYNGEQPPPRSSVASRSSRSTVGRRLLCAERPAPVPEPQPVPASGTVH